MLETPVTAGSQQRREKSSANYYLPFLTQVFCEAPAIKDAAGEQDRWELV